MYIQPITTARSLPKNVLLGRGRRGVLVRRAGAGTLYGVQRAGELRGGGGGRLLPRRRRAVGSSYLLCLCVQFVNITRKYLKSVTESAGTDTTMTIISFYEMHFSYDRSFITQSLLDMKAMLSRLVERHLTDKTLARVDHVFWFFREPSFLDAVFARNSEHRELLGANLPWGRFVIRCWRNLHSFSFLINLLVGEKSERRRRPNSFGQLSRLRSSVAAGDPESRSCGRRGGVSCGGGSTSDHSRGPLPRPESPKIHRQKKKAINAYINTINILWDM